MILSAEKIWKPAKMYENARKWSKLTVISWSFSMKNSNMSLDELVKTGCDRDPWGRGEGYRDPIPFKKWYIVCTIFGYQWGVGPYFSNFIFLFTYIGEQKV